MFYIYGLHLKGDSEIRYIGSTCTPRSRLWAHLRAGDESNPDKEKWVKENRRDVRMKVLAHTEKESDRRRLEQRTIYKYSRAGHRLFNRRKASRDMATTEDVAWWLDFIGDDIR